MKWRITLAAAPAKFIEKLRDQSLRRRRLYAIRSLQTEPRPAACKKLRGGGDVYRIRVSDYRIIYQVEDSVLTVLVVEIGHRRDVYR